MKQTAAIFALFVVGLQAGEVSPAGSAQGEALRRWPALGQAGSEFNRQFLDMVKWYRANKPAFFEDSRWQVRLGESVERTLASEKRARAEAAAKAELNRQWEEETRQMKAAIARLDAAEAARRAAILASPVQTETVQDRINARRRFRSEYAEDATNEFIEQQRGAAAQRAIAEDTARQIANERKRAQLEAERERLIHRGYR